MYKIQGKYLISEEGKKCIISNTQSIENFDASIYWNGIIEKKVIKDGESLDIVYITEPAKRYIKRAEAYNRNWYQHGYWETIPVPPNNKSSIIDTEIVPVPNKVSELLKKFWKISGKDLYGTYLTDALRDAIIEEIENPDLNKEEIEILKKLLKELENIAEEIEKEELETQKKIIKEKSNKKYEQFIVTNCTTGDRKEVVIEVSRISSLELEEAIMEIQKRPGDIIEVDNGNAVIKYRLDGRKGLIKISSWRRW